MGRQVRFANFSADVVALEAFLLQNDAMIIDDSAPTARPVGAPTLRVEDHTSSVLLIVRPVDLQNLRWHHVPARGCWMIDKNLSPVVEYVPGHTRDGRPRLPSDGGHGRMWFQTSRWVKDGVVHADPDFVAWAERLFGWIKNHWVLIESDYYSPAAAELWHATWQIVLDEPCQATGSDQISRWRRQHDPDNTLPASAVHIAISKATRHQPRRLTIAVRAPGH